MLDCLEEKKQKFDFGDFNMAFKYFKTKDTINNDSQLSTGQYTAYTTSPSNMIRLDILSYRGNVLEAIEWCEQRGGTDTRHVKSRLFTFFLQIKNMYEKDFKEKPEKIKSLRYRITKGNYQDLLGAFEEIDEYLYSKGLTKIDLREYYDPMDAIGEDEMNAE